MDSVRLVDRASQLILISPLLYFSSSSGVGVEKTFPIHSPMIEKVEVVKRGAVRRAKLNYMRERTGKAAKIKVKEEN